MRFILTTLIAIFLAFTAAAQSPIFEFECFSNANMTGDSCDICVGTSFQSRSFNGLMVYRLGVFNRWIDEPYLIRLRPGNSVEFIEQTGTSPDRITIPLNQTGFSTISGFIDSTFCAGANIDFSFFASDSLRTTAINYLDTIKIVGRGGTTVFFDTLTQKYIITSPAGGGGGGGTTYTAGTGIAISGGNVISNTSPNINQTISTTGAAGNISLSNSGGTLNLNVNDADANPTNEIQSLSYSAPNLSLSLGGGSVAIPQGDITGSGAATQVSYFTGTKTIASNSGLNYDNSNFNLGIGTASILDRMHTYKSIAGTGLSGLRVDQVNSTAGATRSSRFYTQNYSGGTGRTLFYAASSSLDGERGEFGILSENGARFLTRFGYELTGSMDMSLFNFAGSEKVKFSTNGNSYFDGGNVGIGATSPAQKLDVNGIANSNEFRLGNASYTRVATPDGGGGFVGGYNAKIASSVPSHDSNGTMNALYYSSTGTYFYSQNTAAANTAATVLASYTPGLYTVNGNARITGSTGTGAFVMLRDASGYVSNATLGTGLSITGGTLNATGTVGGTGVAGKVAYWNGTSALTATTNFAFDGTNLAVGAATPGAGRLNVTGNSTSVGLQVDAQTLPSFGSTLQLRGSNSTSNQSFSGLDAEGITTGSGSNYLNKFGNTGAGNTLLQVNTTAAGGDPVVQYNLTGGSANWVHGIDNSDADKFKIQPYSMPGVGSAGITITTAGLVGINQEIPAVALDISTATNGIAIPNGTTAQRPVASVPIIRYNSETQGLEVKNSGNWHLLNSQVVPSLVAGSALGTSAVLTVNGGFETAYTVSMTVGTAPTANAVIYTRNFPFTWSSAPRAVFSAANALTASEITKFYIETTNSSQYTIRANGTLTTGSTYRLNVLVKN